MMVVKRGKVCVVVGRGEVCGGGGKGEVCNITVALALLTKSCKEKGYLLSQGTGGKRTKVWYGSHLCASKTVHKFCC